MKYIKLLLCLCLLYTPFAFAADLPENNSWSWKHHNKMREQARLKALLTKQINESGSSKTISAIVETKPTASKVGGSMLKRIASSGGGQLIGVLAVTELLEAIGWVMEDGTYVKKIPEDDDKDTTHQYLFYENRRPDKIYSDRSTGANAALAYYKTVRNDIDFTGVKTTTDTSIGGVAAYACYNYQGKNYCDDTILMIKKNDNYDPNAEPKEKTVPLTPALLGAAMLGTGYNDPDPDFDNSRVNNDQWTGVPEAYTPDDSGVGNELADELEDKADNAPQTPDGKSSTLTDPRYSNDLLLDDKANDRSWQSGDGTEGSTDTSTTTDSETGTTTSSGSFNLPAFCDWAMTMCQWYDDWKASDKVYKDHMTKTEEHQTEEKSFWEDVKDWFDWTKEPVDQEPETEEEEPDTQGIFDRTFDTAFSLSKECPPDIPFSLETEFFSGSWNISMNWLCIIFTFLGYPLVFLSHCVGLWILYEAVVQREIKW